MMNWLKRGIEKLINRRGRESLPVRFNWRRIYVLPSKPGLFFSLIWFVMLMAALNFNNNMGLMLVFMLFGMAQVMLLTVTKAATTMIRLICQARRLQVARLK